MKKLMLPLIFTLILSAMAYGQEITKGETEYVTIPVNASLLPGFSMSKNAVPGKKIVNNFNFNLLAGSAEKLRGVELGGLVNYYSEDFWGDEAMFTNVGLRSGTHRFHNILFVGKQVTDPLSWTVGYGFGPHFTLSKSGYIEIDLIFQVIGDMANWEDSSYMGKYRLIGGWKIFDFISIYAGPTFNSFRSNENDGSEYALWTISEDKEGDTWTRTSIGFVLGMKIFE